MADDDLNSMKHQDHKYSKFRQVEKSITFEGGTTNAIGDYDGTGDPFTIFTVTGEVAVKIIAVCTTTLTGASATLEIGAGTLAGDTATLIALTTATSIVAGELWHDASPDAQLELASIASEYFLADGADIVGNVKTANILTGVIKFICLWHPLSKNGKVVAA